MKEESWNLSENQNLKSYLQNGNWKIIFEEWECEKLFFKNRWKEEVRRTHGQSSMPEGDHVIHALEVWLSAPSESAILFQSIPSNHLWLWLWTFTLAPETEVGVVETAAGFPETGVTSNSISATATSTFSNVSADIWRYNSSWAAWIPSDGVISAPAEAPIPWRSLNFHTGEQKLV